MFNVGCVVANPLTVYRASVTKPMDRPTPVYHMTAGATDSREALGLASTRQSLQLPDGLGYCQSTVAKTRPMEAPTSCAAAGWAIANMRKMMRRNMNSTYRKRSADIQRPSSAAGESNKGECESFAILKSSISVNDRHLGGGGRTRRRRCRDVRATLSIAASKPRRAPSLGAVELAPGRREQPK